jgi:serine/threonine protein kinase/DNA-binding beta-propeller fold protein YncE
MADDGRVAELLLRWEELHEQGREVSAEELCRDCPECREELARRIHALEVMGWVREAPQAADPPADGPVSADRPVPTQDPLTGIDSAAGLVDALRRSRLLRPAQLEEVRRSLSRFPGPKALARDLVRRGWLTTFQANQLRAGRGGELVLGQYVLLDRLGEGGMGEVFKARHTRMGRTVAVKVIRRERLAHPDAVRRFEREVRATAALSHPNIVLAYDADEVNGRHILVMEYVEGTDLAQAVLKGGPLPVGRACEYVRQAASGLDHAHRRGLVHRDIKPSNLLLTADGSAVKILDLGLARLAAPGSEAEAGSLTQEGRGMGTPDYLAPEQALGAHGVDIRADLYSLGCTFYYLLTGRVPFPGESVAGKLLRHQLDEPEPVERLRPGVPPGVAAVVRRLMAKRPEDRYQTPAEVVAALAGGGAAAANPFDFTAQASVTAEAVARPRPRGQEWTRRIGRKRRLWPWLAGAAGLLLALLIVITGLRRPHEPEGAGSDEPSAVWPPNPPVAKPANFLLVGNEGTNSVLRFKADTGKFVDAVVPPGAGGLNIPVGLAVHEGHLYVASQDTNRVLRLSKKRAVSVETFVMPKSGGLDAPYGIAFGPDGQLYVTSRGDHSVKRYNGKTGGFIDAVVPSGTGGMNNPTGLAFGPDRKLYVASSNHSVISCDVEHGKSVRTFVHPNSGGLANPTALLYGPDGNLYVCSIRGSVLRYDGKTGTFIDVFIQPGAGGLGEPYSLAFGPDDNLYVSGTRNHSILRYNGKSGEFMGAFVPPGAGGLSRPLQILFTTDF